MSVAQYVLLAWFAFSAFTLVSSVGKPRKPLEPQVAAFGVLITAVLAGLVVLA